MPFGKGGPAGSFRRQQKKRNSAASLIQRALRGGGKRRKTTKGLNKVEKRQTKAIIERGKETKFGRFRSYDVRTVYTTDDLQALDQPIGLIGVQNPTGPAASCMVLQTGEYLTPTCDTLNTAMPNSCFVLGGYKMLQTVNGVGLGGNRTIDGDYAYSQSHKISLRIAMKTIRNENSWERNYYPTHFRVLYVRAKPHGEIQTSSIAGGLFINETGSKVGLASPNLSAKFVHQDAIVNPGQWTKVKEYKFDLVPVVQPPGTADPVPDGLQIQGQQLPAKPYERQLDIWMDNPKKKLKFNNATTVGINDNEPMNYDFNNYIVIIASTGTPTQNGAMASNAWTVQMSGTSKFKDM